MTKGVKGSGWSYRKDNTMYCRDCNKRINCKPLLECLNGHITFYNNHLKAQKEPDRQYILQQWRLKNKERIKEHNSKYYKQNKYKYRISQNKRRGLAKVKVFNHYSKGILKCACPGGCNETYMEFLSIDHIAGGGNKHRRTIPKGDFYLWLVRHGLPEGYRVLCMNCNFALGHSGYCPHSKKVN